MNYKLTKICDVLDIFLEKLRSEYESNVSNICDMSGNVDDAVMASSDFLIHTITDEIILALPKNDVIYDFIHAMFEYDSDESTIPYQCATFSHKEYLDYISGLHAFKDKITKSLDVTNEIEYAGNLINVFENDKKFINALFDTDVIADKTGHELTMDVETASREFIFLIRFREYLAEMGKEMEQVALPSTESIVQNRLELLYISSITFYVFKQVESVLKTLREVASIMYGEKYEDDDNEPEVPYGIF